MQQRILHINIPFVTGRCDYYGRALFHGVIPSTKNAYLGALTEEARSLAPEIDTPFDTVCLSNGAIGTLEPQSFRIFLHNLTKTLPFENECRLYAEADPGLLSSALMAELKARGLAMLRIRYLTSDPVESERLERPCSLIEMQKTNIVLESLGTTKIDMQILVGAVGQTTKSLVKTLRDAVLSNDVTHCTIIPAQGRLACENNEKSFLLSVASEFLKEHDFVRYSPLCFAKNESFVPEESNRYSESQHVGIGLSEISHYNKMNWANCADLKTYIDHAANPSSIVAAAFEDACDVVTARAVVRTLYTLNAIDADEPFVAELSSEGLLDCSGDAASLSERGCIEFDRVASTVFAHTLAR